MGYIQRQLRALIDDLKDTSSDQQKKHHATFKEVVKKILVGRQIESGIKVPIDFTTYYVISYLGLPNFILFLGDK